MTRNFVGINGARNRAWCNKPSRWLAHWRVFYTRGLAGGPCPTNSSHGQFWGTSRRDLSQKFKLVWTSFSQKFSQTGLNSWDQSISQSVHQTINQSVDQANKVPRFSQSVSQSNRQSICLSVSPMARWFQCQSIKQPIKQSVKQTSLFKEWHSTNVRVVHYALLSRVTESRRQRIQGAAAEQKNTRVNFLEMQ